MNGMHEVGPLGWHTFLTTWRPDVLWDLLIVVALAGYLHTAGRAADWPVRRTMSFCAGLGVLAITLNSAIGVYAHPLFWMHMVEHLLLIMIVPVLLIAGQPLRLAAHVFGVRVEAVLRSRTVGLMTCVPVGFGFYTVAIAGTHLTSFMQLMLTHPAVHRFEQVLYLVAGIVFFLPLVAREPLRWSLAYPLRFGVLAMAMGVDTFVGVVLMQTIRAPFPAYVAAHRPWEPTPLQDLHGGGAIMWAGGDALMLILMLGVAAAWAADRTGRDSLGQWLDGVRANALADIGGHAGRAAADDDVDQDAELLRGSADVDGDAAALDAYNAMLRRLSRRDG
jgi:putative copper resistance protein D